MGEEMKRKVAQWSTLRENCKFLEEKWKNM
jgi:hypothetical protein